MQSDYFSLVYFDQKRIYGNRHTHFRDFSYNAVWTALHLQRRARSPACESSCTEPSPGADAGDPANVPPADLQEPGTNSYCGNTWETEARLLKEHGHGHHNRPVTKAHTYPSPGTSRSLRPRAWSWLEKLTNSSPSSPPGGLFFLSLARARRAARSSLFLSKSYFLFPFMGFPDCFLDMMMCCITPSDDAAVYLSHTQDLKHIIKFTTSQNQLWQREVHSIYHSIWRYQNKHSITYSANNII